MITVLGAGWYGCHVALLLRAAGHPVCIVDPAGTVFSGASRANQSRLHLGFHYPRNKETRLDAIRNAEKFMQSYGHLVFRIPACVYAVAEDISLIDYDTYRDTMLSSGLQLIEFDPEEMELTNLEGAMFTGEALIDQTRAAEWFTKMLRHSEIKVLKERPGGDGPVVDCTYGALGNNKVARYEPCVTFRFLGPLHFALTVMDGPKGVSLFPYTPCHTFYSRQDMHLGFCTLTSVEETPIGKFPTYAEAVAAMTEFRTSPLAKAAVVEKMLEKILRYIPWFCDKYKLDSNPLYGIRAMPSSVSDARITHVDLDPENPSVVRILPGKISAVHDVDEPLMRIVRQWEEEGLLYE